MDHRSLAEPSAEQLARWSAPKFRMPPRGGKPSPVYPLPPYYEIQPCPGGCPNCDFNICCGYIPFEGVAASVEVLTEALDRYTHRRLNRD